MWSPPMNRTISYCLLVFLSIYALILRQEFEVNKLLTIFVSHLLHCVYCYSRLFHNTPYLLSSLNLFLYLTLNPSLLHLLLWRPFNHFNNAPRAPLLIISPYHPSHLFLIWPHRTPYHVTITTPTVTICS